MCSHTPPCPAPSAPDREAAHTIVSHPEQGWSLLCNGVVIFEDTGELLPGGAFIAPHRPTDLAGHGGRGQVPAALSSSGWSRSRHQRMTHLGGTSELTVELLLTCTPVLSDAVTSSLITAVQTGRDILERCTMH